MDAHEEPRWEIADQWRRAWRRLKWSALILAGLVALLTLGQAISLFQALSAVHPVLGLASAIACAAVAGRFIAIPAIQFLKTPTIVKPPDIDLAKADLARADVARRWGYDAAYLGRLAANPALGPAQATARAALEDLKALKPGPGTQDARGAAARLAAFEHDRIDALLTDLDKEVEAYIHREAVLIGVSSAVSLNGSLDALIVLWRNVNMVSRVARLYYGRPDLRVSLTIMRDVAAAVLLARALDDVSEAAGEALGGVLGKLGGVVVAPVMEGSINALMSLKVGYLAKTRCRSFEPWSEARAGRAVAETFERVKRESSGIVGELLSACGGAVGRAAEAAGGAAGAAAEAVITAPKTAWSIMQDAFVKKAPTDGA